MMAIVRRYRISAETHSVVPGGLKMVGICLRSETFGCRVYYILFRVKLIASVDCFVCLHGILMLATVIITLDDAKSYKLEVVA